VTLDALIRGRRKSEPVGFANAKIANIANIPHCAPPILAKLAKLALANPRGAETEDTVGHPAVLWWRAAILDPGGRTIELDTASGWTLADWQAYADRYHGPACAVTPIAGLPKPAGTSQPR
jgi:hypothetical protein